MRTLPTLALPTLAALALVLPLTARADDDRSPYQRAAEALRAGIQGDDDTVARAVDRALALLPDDALAAAELTAARRAGSLRSRARAVAERLAFTPTMESPLPDGWPAFSPVGEPVLRRYPTYRVAKASMVAGSRNLAFFRLFSHIKRRKIAMTVPVQMDFAQRDETRRAISMGFLYREQELGPKGKDGGIRIVDVAPQPAVSIGARGAMGDREAIAAARRQLEAWIARQPRWQAAGPMRLMVWNSPMVPASRSYYEVQIPLEPAEDARRPTSSAPASEPDARRYY